MKASRRAAWVAMLIGLLAAAFAAAQPRPARIAFVANAEDASTRAIVDAFRAGLGELGHVEGRSYVLDLRYGKGRPELFPPIVADAISRGSDVIVTVGFLGAVAAKRATQAIPIAGFSCGLDVLVDSLARPGGNLTGVTCQSADLLAKQLQLLRQALPELRRVAVLNNPASTYGEPGLRALREAGHAMGVQTTTIDVRSPADFDAAVAQVRRAKAEAVLVAPDATLFAYREPLVNPLLAERLPVMGFFREFVDAGALMSYSASRVERFHRLWRGMWTGSSRAPNPLTYRSSSRPSSSWSST